MGLLILLAMIVVPITEIAVFIKAGDLIGLWPTIGTVILTAMIGTSLLRHQGLATLSRVRESMDAGRLPVEELFDGLCLLVAGALLLTPGFVTDGLGLLLFMPPFRSILRGLMAQRLKARGNFNMRPPGGMNTGQKQKFDATIIEGEFQEVTPEENGSDSRPPLPPRGERPGDS